MPLVDARALLFAAGLSVEQTETVTGFGRRHVEGCENDDTVTRKLAAGALSVYGVMGVVFGSDSVQHHRGHNLPIMRPVEVSRLSGSDLRAMCDRVCDVLANGGRSWLSDPMAGATLERVAHNAIGCGSADLRDSELVTVGQLVDAAVEHYRTRLAAGVM
jgi:hypothetical protein